MTNERLNVGVIIGSTREGRFADVIAAWVLARANERTDMTFDVIDLREADLPAVHPASSLPSVRAFSDRIGRADAYVVITPEYNHGYPASLKAAIDLVYEPWRRKPVAFVSYGGLSGGIRAVEQLRQVFAELHAVTIRDGVAFAMAGRLFDADGELREPAGSAAAATVMLDQLAWWGNTLRAGRRESARELAGAVA